MTDDWARRKGHTYGTLLVDLETSRVVDVLPDREAESLTAWLQAHPGVEIISRDRAGAYAEGATKGAPHVQQVADRWHLLKNLGEALVKVLEPHRRALRTLSVPGAPDPYEQGSSINVALVNALTSLSPAQLMRQRLRREHRYARYQQVRDLRQRGYTLSAIAAQTGLDRKTVRKYINHDAFPEWQPRCKRWSILDPYKGYLVDRWNGGCRTGAQLYREIQAQGYRGGISVVATFVSGLRKLQGLPPRSRMVVPQATLHVSSERPLTPRRAAWLVFTPADQLTASDRVLVELLPALHDSVRRAVELVQAFAAMVRQRRPEELLAWLVRAEESGIPALRSFATGIRRDYTAVEAAMALVWSNGPVEGHVNRLKFIKRQMYGRADFDLLRRRVLYSG